MPADLLTRINLDYLYPPFMEEMLQVIAACRDRGHDYFALYGWRSYGRQHQLRMNFLAGRGGKAAPAGYSQHQFGLAADFCSDRDLMAAGLQPDWNDKAYIVLGEEVAKRPLLHWGNLYGDKPHVGWRKFIDGEAMEPLRQAWKNSNGTDLERLKAVWAVIDKEK